MNLKEARPELFSGRKNESKEVVNYDTVFSEREKLE